MEFFAHLSELIERKSETKNHLRSRWRELALASDAKKVSLSIIAIIICTIKKETLMDKILYHLKPKVGMQYSVCTKILSIRNNEIFKRKSSLIIFDRHANLKYKYENRNFLAQGLLYK